mmetsp:Transcript_27910/g.93934  ORF Transcript_27910/g.93934 Transcript_27910/m.93934 type:complete len:254 (+) Transcript_27910:599-1360(+)
MTWRAKWAPAAAARSSSTAPSAGARRRRRSPTGGSTRWRQTSRRQSRASTPRPRAARTARTTARLRRVPGSARPSSPAPWESGRGSADAPRGGRTCSWCRTFGLLRAKSAARRSASSARRRPVRRAPRTGGARRRACGTPRTRPAARAPKGARPQSSQPGRRWRRGRRIASSLLRSAMAAAAGPRRPRRRPFRNMPFRRTDARAPRRRPFSLHGASAHCSAAAGPPPAPAARRRRRWPCPKSQGSSTGAPLRA